MSNSYPRSKVTIIVEEGDAIITTVFHLVEEPSMHVNYRDVAVRLGEDGAMPRPISKADFSINGVAVFDVTEGSYFTYERTKKDGA